jgi:hypothetical protein
MKFMLLLGIVGAFTIALVTVQKALSGPKLSIVSIAMIYVLFMVAGAFSLEAVEGADKA